ncbi:ABC transporter permease [Methylocaldum sp.]|uniref:ABC transporter permease n=1 Tax=Methylocaldum sp. TaxID=1969727 RepID=UPI002D67FF8B|nr:ABC transporter permease [Methylocaldum sp.]HYE36953.1 ABC transporter permease [Methylocaldum sp.]
MDYFADSFLAALRLIFQFDPKVYQIVWISLRISLTATVCAALLAVPAGVWSASTEFTGKRLLRQSLNSLMAMPTVMIGLIFYGLFSRRGPLGDFGLLYTPAAVIIGEAVLVFPLVMNLAMTAVESADPRLLPTLRSLGASRVQQFGLVLSETRLSLLVAVAAGFGRAIGEVGTAMMLGGNIQGLTRTMTTAIALETNKGEFELGLALGMMLLLVAFSVNWLLRPVERSAG